MWRPRTARAPVRARHSFGFPINSECRDIVAVTCFTRLCCLCLPAGIGTNRTNYLYPIFLLAAHQQLPINIASVQQVLTRQQLLVFQSLVSRYCHVCICYVRLSSLHIGNEMDLVRVTVAGFGDMCLVPGPGGAPLVAIRGLWVLGRVDARASRWQVLSGAQLDLAFQNHILLDPNATQYLQRWDFP